MAKPPDPKIAKRNEEIYALYKAKNKKFGMGRTVMASLGKEFGLSANNIRKIVTGPRPKKAKPYTLKDALTPATLRELSMTDLNSLAKSTVQKLEVIKAEIRKRQDKNLFD